MGWKLTVGGADLTPFVTSFTLSETASSSQDTGGISVNGSHDSIVPGAAVTLTDANGVTAWEGYVLFTNTQPNATGVQVSTLANKCSLGYHFGSASGNDVAVLAQGLLGATSIPWGGPANFGVNVGGLTFDRVDSGLSVLSLLAGSTWRVQNGSCAFVNAASGIAEIPVALQTTPNAYSSVSILAGADINTRIPLSQTVTPIGSPIGPVGQVSYHEIADAGTLGILAANLGEMYGLGAVSASANLSQTVRAGDWVQDQNGIVTVAWSVRWSIVAGLLQASVQFGFPALPQEPQYSAALSDSLHRYPVARLTSDYVVQGCSASISGATVTMSAGIASIGGTLTPALSTATLTPSSGVSYVTATASGYTLQSQPMLPGTGVNLYRVSVANGVIVGLTDIRQHGGVGKPHMIPTVIDGTNGVWDLTNNLFDHANAMSHATQDVVILNSGNGQLNVAPPGSVVGQIVGTNIFDGTIQTTHIANQAVTGPLVQSTIYSTNQANTAGSGSSASDWYSLGFGNYITSSNYTITNGDTIKWNTGSGSYLGSSDPYMESLTLAGSASAIVIFQHSAFLSGAGGRPRIFFQGQSSGSTTSQQETTGFSGSSTCSVSATARYKVGVGYYDFQYSQANGATYTVSVSPNESVGSGTPLALNLTSVNCPGSADGSSSLTVQLKDSSGAILDTWTGITTTQTLSYPTAHAADTFTWSIWAVPVNLHTGSEPYNENMQDTFSGSATYYNSVGSTGQTYVKGVDGTARLTASDSNIQFTILSCDTIAFQIFNSSTSATGFSLGLDVGGL